jgi:hypothetical protein
VKKTLGPAAQVVAELATLIRRVAIACARRASLNDAREIKADVLTGEMRFHDFPRTGYALILPGHYATERSAPRTVPSPGMARFGTGSCRESDPVSWRWSCTFNKHRLILDRCLRIANYR